MDTSTRRMDSWGRLAAGLMAGVVAMALVACGREEAPKESEDSAPAAVGRTEEGQPAVRPKFLEVPIGPRRTLKELPWEVAWDLRLPAPVHASWISPSIPELVFFQLQSREIHAVDLASGMTKWVTMPLPKRVQFPPYVARVEFKVADSDKNQRDDRLYVVSGDYLYAFDGVFGELIWRLQLGQAGDYGFEPCSGPYATGYGENLRVFIGDWEGRIRACTFHPQQGRAYVRWQYNLGAPPTAVSSGVSELTYTCDHGGKIACFGLEREPMWSFDTLSPLYGSPLLRGTRLYAGSEAGLLFALHRLSGQEMNKLFLQVPLRRPPMAFNREPLRIYLWAALTNERGGLYAIKTLADSVAMDDVNLASGEPRTVEVERLEKEWLVPGINRLVASSPAHLYVMTATGSTVLALNRRTGTFDWNWDLNEGREPSHEAVHITQYQDPTDELRTIVTADAQGRVVAYRLFGQYK